MFRNLSAATVAILTLAASAMAQTSSDSDTYASTKAFLRAAFPALIEEKAVFSIQDDDWMPLANPPDRRRQLYVRVATAIDNHSPDPPKILMTARVQFDAAGTLVSFLASEPDATTDTTRERLIKRFADPELTDGNIEIILRNSGIRFNRGDDADVMKFAGSVFERLRNFAGRVEIESVDLDIRGSLLWQVQAHGVGSEPLSRYSLLLDPFAGSLVGFRRF